MFEQAIQKVIFTIPVVFVMFASTSTQAALIDRGGDLYYDDVLNVTWMTNVDFYHENVAATGWVPTHPSQPWQDSGGSYITSYPDVAEWVDQLEYAGSSDWRLPYVNPVNGSNYELGHLNGDFYSEDSPVYTDHGYGITSEASELSHLLNVTLGNIGGRDPLGGIYGAGTMENEGPFTGLFTYHGYWTDIAECGVTPSFVIDRDGLQRQVAYCTNLDEGTDGVLVLADGDIAVDSPEPATLGLMGAALAGLGLTRHRKFRK